MRRIAGLPAVYWWLWLGYLLSSLGTFVFPFLALYLSSRGIDARQTGLVLSLLGVGAVLAGPIGGQIADHAGRKPALLLALGFSAASALYLGFVRSLLAIAPGVLAFGLGMSMARPAMQAIVADVLPVDLLGRAYALLYWVTNVGVAVSAWVGGVLAGRTWLGLFAGDALTTLLFAAVVVFRIPESRPSLESEGRPAGWMTLAGDRPLLGFLATHFAFMIVFWQFQFALPLAVLRNGFGTREYGRLMALNCAAVFVTQPFTTRWLRSFDRGVLLAIASVCVGGGFGAYGLCSTMPQFYGATLVWTIGDVVGLPLVSAVVATMSPVDLRGRYQGAQMLAQALAMVGAPLLAGAVIDAFGLRALWGGCVVVGLGAAVSHALLGAARRRRLTLAD
jgi:MFS family permease